MTIPTGSERTFRVSGRACNGCRLATSSDGHVALVIDATGSGASITRALPSFRFDPPHEVEIEEGPRESVEHVATLLCGSKDEAIESTFVRIAIACLDTTASNLTDTELEVRIDEFAWVFGAAP